MADDSIGNFDFILRCIVIGTSGAGKSSLTVRLSEDVFFADYASTIAIDFRMYTMRINNQSVKLQIWDTAGQERFRAVTSSFYRGANGVLLCFSVTDRSSFEGLGGWLESVRMQCLPGVPVVLIGCKCDDDANRKVPVAEAEGWARQHGMAYVETSAKSNHHVHEAFRILAERIMELNKQRGVLPPQGGNSASIGTVGGGGASGVRLGGNVGGPGANRGGAVKQADSGCGC